MPFTFYLPVNNRKYKENPHTRCVIAVLLDLIIILLFISLLSDSLNYNAAFFFDFKQLPPAKNVEILSGLLTESKKRKI